MSPIFNSAAEFREVIDRTLAIMSTDPEIGPRLWHADARQRFEFADYELVVNICAVAPRGTAGNLIWEWTDEVSWEPRVKMAMMSETANRYLQGKENVALAIARRRIRASGDVKAALGVLPLIRPLFARYRQMVVRDYPHLEV